MKVALRRFAKAYITKSYLPICISLAMGIAFPVLLFNIANNRYWARLAEGLTYTYIASIVGIFIAAVASFAKRRWDSGVFHTLMIPFLLIWLFVAAEAFERRYSDIPSVKFPGLREKSVIFDGGILDIRNEGACIMAYQLYPVDTRALTADKRWLPGPINESRYKKAFYWFRLYRSDNGGKTPRWHYEEWLKSKHFYFYLERYHTHSDSGTEDYPHYSRIWVLDSRSYRLYNVAGGT